MGAAAACLVALVLFFALDSVPEEEGTSDLVVSPTASHVVFAEAPAVPMGVGERVKTDVVPVERSAAMAPRGIEIDCRVIEAGGHPVTGVAVVFEATEPAVLVPAARAVATAPIVPASIVLSFSSEGAGLLVRLHGAADTVDADQRMLEAHAGVSFSAREGPEAGALLASTRDAGMDAEVLLHAHTLRSWCPSTEGCRTTFRNDILDEVCPTKLNLPARQRLGSPVSGLDGGGPCRRHLP